MSSIHPRGAGLLVEVGDDAAVRHDGVVVTVDALVQGRHFTDDTPASDIGHKLLAVSVSDVWAMGATPEHAVLALSLGPLADDGWVDGFARGLQQASERYGVHLIGGDTVGTEGPTTLSLTLLGRAGPTVWRRSGAEPGDVLLITGQLGLAGAGWMLPSPPQEALRALRRPDPPVGFARALASAGLDVHAAMDLSDGLATDAPRMAEASGVQLRFHPGRLPVHPLLGGRADALRLATCGGEDFQLLLAVAPDAVDAVLRLGDDTGTQVSVVGEVGPGEGAELVGRPWPSGAFDHFGASP
jgi:thiamine-monophosphate kinase